MNHYFTISKFARLRGIDINSLRYYERLGILTPAYVDPRTRYRYYAPEQLSVLDMILLCINLGISLKQLAAYIDQGGDFHSRDLFEEGKRRAQEKICELQNSLRSIEHTLNYLEDSGQYVRRDAPYRRLFPQRRLVTRELGDRMPHASDLETAFAQLNGYAREQKLYPVLPMGLLYRCAAGGAKRSIYWEISEPAKEDPHILALPQGEYLCLQVICEPGQDIESRIAAQFDFRQAAMILVSSMARSRFHFGSKCFEIQYLSRPSQGF